MWISYTDKKWIINLYHWILIILNNLIILNFIWDQQVQSTIQIVWADVQVENTAATSLPYFNHYTIISKMKLPS